VKRFLRGHNQIFASKEIPLCQLLLLLDPQRPVFLRQKDLLLLTQLRVHKFTIIYPEHRQN
jgi:hypothetical protein